MNLRHGTRVLQAAVLAGGLLSLWPLAAVSQDTSPVAAGRAKAQACAVCHGPLGISSAPDAPHLAGQPAIYLARQLRAYRGGERKHEVMAVIAQPLSDADIDHLAAWFASVQVQATPPK